MIRIMFGFLLAAALGGGGFAASAFWTECKTECECEVLKRHPQDVPFNGVTTDDGQRVVTECECVTECYIGGIESKPFGPKVPRPEDNEDLAEELAHRLYE